jgi:hypothetical protein
MMLKYSGGWGIKGLTKPKMMTHQHHTKGLRLMVLAAWKWICSM